MSEATATRAAYQRAGRQTRYIHADEIRPGYRIIDHDDADPRERVAERVQHVFRHYLVLVTWEGRDGHRRRRSAWPRDKQVEVVLEDGEF